MVYVQDREGRPLMPTARCGWVAYALKHGEAKVVRGDTFTIRLLRDSTRYLQEVTLGVDVGSKHIGLSASTKKEELYSAQVEMRTNVSELLTARMELRKGRRGRKRNWYRPPRFNNRKKAKGELPPSIRHKADSHVRAINNVLKILPVVRINIEIGEFDSQKIQNPSISGEQYQNGTLAGWENLKSYAKWRDGYKCMVCGKSHRTDHAVHLEVHHIRRRADGGSDTPDNVVTLCHECHESHHKKAMVLKFRRPPVHKNEAHMNSMRKYLVERVSTEFPEQTVTVKYGYETAMARREHNVEKSHIDDAFCIAGNFDAIRNSINVYLHRFVRRHNRRIHDIKFNKGGKRRNKNLPRIIFGVRLYDRVNHKGDLYFIKTRRKSGTVGMFSLTRKGDIIERTIHKIKRLYNTAPLLTERILT